MAYHTKEKRRNRLRARYQERRAQGLCISCGRKNDTGGVNCQSCADKANSLAKKFNQQVKQQVVVAYGGKCACCQEKQLEFLTIDHIDGNGRQHRREIGVSGGSAFYRWLKKNNYPDGFRVLCYNCNCAIGHWGYCPHEPRNKEA